MSKRRSQAEAWEDQARKCLATIEKFAVTPSMHGLKWQHKMVNHYSGILGDILRQTPRGKSQVRRAILDEYEAIRAKFNRKFS